MVALHTPNADIGWKAKDFKLKGVDGKTYSLKDVKGENGLVVMFICNHCPYVKAIMEKLILEAASLRSIGVGVVAINSNDADAYPEDSFENMQKLADERMFNFPYLYDEKQEVAKAYDAVCTPDFFGFDAGLGLQYRGRLDDSGMTEKVGGKRELFEAMKILVETGQTPASQVASIGCSIKWRA